jgi:hypothetical protein
VPFAPEIAIPTLMNLRDRFGDRLYGRYGFKDAFNLSYPKGSGGAAGWFDDQYLGIDQGPILLMVENYRTGFVWNLMKRSPYLTAGLVRAGFGGGWLSTLSAVPGAAVSQRLAPAAGTWPGGGAPPPSGRAPPAAAPR